MNWLFKEEPSNYNYDALGNLTTAQRRLNGTLSTDLQLLGKLKVVEFANERALKKSGASLYEAPGQTAQASTNTRVRQGMMEKSNVEPMIEICR